MGERRSKLRSILKRAAVGCAVLVVLLGAGVVWLVSCLMPPSDPVKMTEHHPFKSAKAKHRYLEYYDRRAESWPVESETSMVPTSYGDTFTRISGPEEAEPLLLLPGGNATSLIWEPNIEELSRHFRVYALDNIYDFGRSVYAKHVRTPEDFVLWIDEVIDGLQIEGRVNLAGLSYGGWITSQYALSRPERVDRAVLLAPAATVLSFDPEFLKRAALILIPHKYFVRSTMSWVAETAASGDAACRHRVDLWVEDVWVGMRSFSFKQLVNPTVLSDDELAGMEVPILFVVGEKEKIYSAEDAVARLARVAPRIEVELVSGAGHDMTLVKAAQVNATIVDFLSRK